MTGGMNYKGIHRKYAEGSSEYVTYHYGDVVKREANSMCVISTVHTDTFLKTLDQVSLLCL